MKIKNLVLAGICAIISTNCSPKQEECHWRPLSAGLPALVEKKEVHGECIGGNYIARHFTDYAPLGSLDEVLIVRRDDTRVVLHRGDTGFEEQERTYLQKIYSRYLGD